RRRHAAWAKAFAKRDQESDEALYHLGRSGEGAKAREALFELARRLSRKGLSQDSLDNLRLAEPLAGGDLEAATKIRLKIGEELISLNLVPEALAHFDKLRDEIKKLPSNGDNVKLK